MPAPEPSCSVYACHEAASFVLLHDDELSNTTQLPVDCLCAQHWLQIRVFNPERAYKYVSIKYASTPEESSTPASSAS